MKSPTQSLTALQAIKQYRIDVNEGTEDEKEEWTKFFIHNTPNENGLINVMKLKNRIKLLATNEK